MGRNAVVLLPQMDHILSNLGENIKLARLRRRLSAEIVAERAGISRATLTKVEKGSSSVSMGIYASVLFALGLEKDLLKVASDDVLGRKLQDLDLVVHKRAPKRIKENLDYLLMHTSSHQGQKLSLIKLFIPS